MKYLFLITLISCSLIQEEFSSLTRTTKKKDIEFSTDLIADKEFVETNKDEIEKQFIQLDEYFGVLQNKKIKIEILPFDRNPILTKCSRNYGADLIYVHSPSSLDSLSNVIKSRLEKRCLTMSLRELKFEIYHRYVQSILLNILDSKTKIPAWFLEGVSFSLGGRLQNTSYIYKVETIVKNNKAINLCRKFEDSKDGAILFALALLYIENSRKGFIKRIVNKWKRSEFDNMNNFLTRQNITCIIDSQKAFKALEEERGLTPLSLK